MTLAYWFVQLKTKNVGSYKVDDSINNIKKKKKEESEQAKVIQNISSLSLLWFVVHLVTSVELEVEIPNNGEINQLKKTVRF